MVNEVEFKKANNYSLKYMHVAFIVMVIAWILNILHIFIVDQTIMNNTLIGVAIFLLLGYAVKYVLGFEKELVTMVGDVEENLENSRRANEQIVSSARDTSADCDESCNQVVHIQENVSEMSEAIDGIYQNTKGMFRISEDVTNHTLGFVKTMDVAVDSMNQIKETANQTRASISQLENGIDEITKFVGQISASTNLLALNASIEETRAGEQGRGFAVVADNVQQLAEQSKAASNSIQELIPKILAKLEGVKSINGQNRLSVEAGIDKILDARNKAESLGDMQKNSITMTEQIVERSNKTRLYSEQVRGMALSLDELVSNFKSRADEIVDDANSCIYLTLNFLCSSIRKAQMNKK